MKRIYLLLLLFQPVLLFADKNANCSRNDLLSHNSNDTLIVCHEEAREMTEIANSYFDFDDSLLLASYPEAGIKPIGPMPLTSMPFQHSLKIHYTPQNTTSPNYLIITTQALYPHRSRHPIKRIPHRKEPTLYKWP